jgi:hypothetical protein
MNPLPTGRGLRPRGCCCRCCCCCCWPYGHVGGAAVTAAMERRLWELEEEEEGRHKPAWRCNSRDSDSTPAGSTRWRKTDSRRIAVEHRSASMKLHSRADADSDDEPKRGKRRNLEGGKRGGEALWAHGPR